MALLPVIHDSLPRLDRQTSTYGALTKTFNNNTRHASLKLNTSEGVV